MTRVLVTGGSGLVGGRAAQHLAAAGFQVRLGTRRVASAPAVPAGAEVVRTDWADEGQLRQVCDGVDVVVNAMGMNAGDCAADPVAALLVNGVHCASLVRAAAAAGVRRFIHLSTAHVYGSRLQGTVSETSCPANIHPYATSHLAGEQAVLWAAATGRVDGAVLRLSNAYGRPSHPGVNCWMLLVNDLCRQAVEKKSLTLRGNGLQYRDFIPLGSVCGFIADLCRDASQAPATAGARMSGVFNVGRGSSMSTASMASLVQARCHAVLGYEVRVQTGTEGGGGDSAPELRYLSERLDRAILHTEEYFIAEIDELLLFCRDHFSSQPQ